jgi:hypothetical protein
MPLAIKFFFDKDEFDAEAAATGVQVRWECMHIMLVCRVPRDAGRRMQELRAVMPELRLLKPHRRSLGALPAPLGEHPWLLPAPLGEHPWLPPGIVSEKGEPLDDYVARLPGCCCALAALLAVARVVESVHAAGWVHRDLKPTNALLLPAQACWALIDWAWAAKAGAPAT